jgi:3D (Asp-Asp-Asp) domain-containing protein
MRITLAFIALLTMLIIITGSKGTPTGLYARKEPPKNAPASILTTFTVTAYCRGECCCGEYSDGITASGHEISEGDRFIAAPKEYDFGTTFIIPGYGKAKCLDRGGAITGNKIDVYFDTHQEALNWGNVPLLVEIIK